MPRNTLLVCCGCFPDAFLLACEIARVFHELCGIFRSQSTRHRSFRRECFEFLEQRSNKGNNINRSISQSITSNRYHSAFNNQYPEIENPIDRWKMTNGSGKALSDTPLVHSSAFVPLADHFVPAVKKRSINPTPNKQTKN